MEDDPQAAAELKKRSLAFVAELTEAMHEVINDQSTQVGNSKVFMKATFAVSFMYHLPKTKSLWRNGKSSSVGHGRFDSHCADIPADYAIGMITTYVPLMIMA